MRARVATRASRAGTRDFADGRRCCEDVEDDATPELAQIALAMLVLGVVALAVEFLITRVEDALLRWSPPQFTETGY